jgi:hypothetical protein
MENVNYSHLRPQLASVINIRVGIIICDLCNNNNNNNNNVFSLKCVNRINIISEAIILETNCTFILQIVFILMRYLCET